jgi:hypothetical protein
VAHSQVKLGGSQLLASLRNRCTLLIKCRVSSRQLPLHLRDLLLQSGQLLTTRTARGTVSSSGSSSTGVAGSQQLLLQRATQLVVELLQDGCLVSHGHLEALQLRGVPLQLGCCCRRVVVQAAGKMPERLDPAVGLVCCHLLLNPLHGGLEEASAPC